MKLVLFGLAALFAAAPASAERDAAATGINSSGGQAFRDRCLPGEALIGIMARVDVYEMTALAGICARPVSDGEVDPASVRQLPAMHGTNDGRERPLRCASPSPVVRSLYLNMRGANLQLHCFAARKGALIRGGPLVGASWGGAGDGVPIYLTVPSDCGEDEMAVGFYGRHDFRIFQLGLICDTAPGYNLPVSTRPGDIRQGPGSTGPRHPFPPNPRPNRPQH